MYKKWGWLFIGTMVLMCAACGDQMGHIFESTQASENVDLGIDVVRVGGDEYYPPEDGRITEDQMSMFIAVRKIELEIKKNGTSKSTRSSQKSTPPLAPNNRLLADSSLLRAAQALQVNAAEYQWVGDTIDSQLPGHQHNQAAEYINNEMIADVEANYIKIQRVKKSTDDPKLLSLYSQQLAQLSNSIVLLKRKLRTKERQKFASKHNKKLIARFKNQFQNLGLSSDP